MSAEDLALRADAEKLARLADQLDNALAALEQTRAFARFDKVRRVMDIARRLLLTQGGAEVLYARSERMDLGGVFSGSDWEHPESLQPGLTGNTLRLSPMDTLIIECLSELRMLAIAEGAYLHSDMSAEQARHFLAQVLALNLDLLFGMSDETQRNRETGAREIAHGVLDFLARHVGYDHIIDKLIDEVWRQLSQRPLRADGIVSMITRIAACLADPDLSITGGHTASRLVSALFGPTRGCADDPGLDAYRERLVAMDDAGLREEASGFARAMHDTGLVSAYHVVLVHHLRDYRDDMLSTALGLSSTGSDCLMCYSLLVQTLIDEAIVPETAQALYGLALLLERGLLYAPPIAPGLWRQINLVLSEQTRHILEGAYGADIPARVRLLAGVIGVLGQPLGIGQGDNPTCQSARAISMWSYNDPDYLLQLITWASRDDEILLNFEGQLLSSRYLLPGAFGGSLIDVDPVSAVLVPHLDAIYHEMGRICADRDEDPHRWINPEFHGWWVGRGFRIAVFVETGGLREFDDFVRHFFSTYHPYYNGNQPVVHPQPAGLAVTDSTGRFVGWHAITLIRVALDPAGEMRAYFFNPNNDSGQDWGHGVVVATEGNGERYGEASLPVEQFVSRLYIFHYDPLEHGDAAAVPDETIDAVTDMARLSWAAGREE